MDAWTPGDVETLWEWLNAIELYARCLLWLGFMLFGWWVGGALLSGGRVRWR